MDRRKTDRRRDARQDFQIPSIEELFDLCLKRWRLLATLFIVPVFLCLLLLLIKPDSYRATTAVILENQNVKLADFQDVLAGMKFDNLTVPTQVEVISSPSLAAKTIASLNLHLDDQGNLAAHNQSPQDISDIDTQNIDFSVLKVFQKNLDIDKQGASRVIEISFSSHAPALAALIANTHAKQYVLSHIQDRKKHAEALNTWISGEILSLKEESLEKSHAVQSFKSETGMVQGLNSEDLIYEQISDIAKQLSPIATKELDLQARVELLKQGKSNAIREVLDSSLIQSLKSRASIAAQKLESISADLGSKHPKVIAAKKELDQINADIKQEIENIRRSIENELETTIKQKQLLKKSLIDLQQKADSFQEKKITLQALQLEASASQKLLDNFMARSEEIKSQIDFARPDIRIFSFAAAPGEPNSSGKTLILLILSVLSAIFALSVVLTLEFIDQGITRKEDIKNALNLKLLGTLPEEEHHLRKVTNNKSRSPYLEEIKRISIHLGALTKTKTVLFTSTHIGEGKTITAVALAYYLHTIGKRVLLIDANTLTPQVSGLTGVKNKPGFYELMAGTDDINTILQQNEDGITVISAGEQNPFSSDLLVAGRFQEKLDLLRPNFDYIIVDCACALEASDAEILAKLCDQTVIVTSWASTKKKHIKKAAETLREISGKAPYIILNKVPQSILKQP